MAFGGHDDLGFLRNQIRGARLVIHSGHTPDPAGVSNRERGPAGKSHRPGAVNMQADGTVRPVPARIKTNPENRMVRAVVRTPHPGDNRPGMNMNMCGGNIVIVTIDDVIAVNLHIVIIT